MSFKLSKTQKIIISALGVIALLVVLFISWAGGKASEYIKEQVAKQTVLKGSMQVDDIGAAFSGDVWISNITWHDPDGKLVAKIPRLNISLKLGDIFGEGLGANSVQLITLERPELYLSYDKDAGLNIAQLINVTGEENKEPEKQKDSKGLFRGRFEIAKGYLQIESGKNKLVYENFDAQLDYKNLPNVTGIVQAKQNNADFAGNIEIEYLEKGQNIKLSLEGRGVKLTDFFNMVPVESNLKVTGGDIAKIQVTAELNEGEPLKMQVAGDISGGSAQTEGIKIDTVAGEFSGNQDEINFMNVTGKLNEQNVQVDGKVIIKDSPYQLDLRIQSNAFKLNALSPGMTISDPLAFNAAIKGTPEKPVANGDFSANTIKTDQLTVVNAKGVFSYADDVVRLTDTSGSVYGGSVNANGMIKLSDQSFAFNLNGSGISSTDLTSTKLSGPLSFSANATGTANDIAADGIFSIGKGNFNGIPFNSMTGNFSKRGEIMSVSNVVINTLAGTVTTKATVQSDGKIKFDDIDIKTISVEDAKEKIKDEIKDEIEKGRGKISDTLKKIF